MSSNCGESKVTFSLLEYASSSATLNVPSTEFGTGNFSDTLTASVLASTGKRLKATIVFTANGITQTVLHGNDVVYIKQGSASSPDNATVDIALGPNVYKRVSQMSTIFNPKDQSILGTIDGRQLATYKQPPPSLSASTAKGPKMADFGAAPTATMIANLIAEDFTLLSAKIKSTKMDCGIATTFPKPGTHDLETRDLIARDGLDRTYTNGHISNTYHNAGCESCKAGVEVTFGSVMAGCMASSLVCGITFGIECAICWAAAFAEFFGGVYACHRSGACCPTACAPPSYFGDSPCCFQGETCLNSDIGLCYKPEERTCGGKSCCHDSQICMGNGPAKGTCCPPQAVCNGGTTCCKDVTQCFLGNMCCVAEKQCGGNCCADGPNMPFDKGYCANKNTGLCCHGSQVEVDGICCQPGEKNIGGKCVDPRGRCGAHAECDPKNDKCPLREHCDAGSKCCMDTIF